MTAKDTKTEVNEEKVNKNTKALTNPNAEALKNAAFQLYTSAHIGTDDVAERLKKLEAYMNKVDGE